MEPEIPIDRQPSPTAYDTNFCFPVRELESERVKLTPFIVSHQLRNPYQPLT
jgi:hypothetical protein